MKIVRAPAGSTGANRTRRRGTTVRPYRTTRSSAITSPRSGSKCGSKYSRVTSSRADRSNPLGADSGRHVGEDRRGLHEVRGHDPVHAGRLDGRAP